MSSYSLSSFLSQVILLLAAFYSCLSFCIASPVSRDSHQPKLHGEVIEKDWLTLATAVPSNVNPQANIASSSRHQDKAQTFASAPSLIRNHGKAPIIAAPIGGTNKASRDWHLLSDSLRQKLRANAVGQIKKQQRQDWQKKFKDQSPPITLLSSTQLEKMGINPSSNRHHVSRYLEVEKMRKENVPWPLEDIPKPIVHNRFQPLIKKTPRVEDAMLSKKQAELDKLFDDAGLLVTSDLDKKLASDLYTVNTRRRRNGRHTINLEGNQ